MTPRGTAVTLPAYSGNRRSTDAQPAAADTGELTISQLFFIVLRRWTVALPLFVLTLAGAWALYASAVPIYEAAATIRIDKGKETLPGISTTPVSAFNSPYELSTEIQLLQSRAIAADVARQTAYAVQVVDRETPRSALFDSVALDSAAKPGTYTLTKSDVAQLTFVGPSGARVNGAAGQWLAVDGVRVMPTRLAAREREVQLQVLSPSAATDAVRGALKVTQPVRDAEVLRLTVRETDPRLAAALSDAAADVFAKSQTRRRQQGGRTTVAFIRSQLDSLNDQLRDAEVMLRNWRQAQKVVVPTAEAGNAVTRRAGFEQRVAESRILLGNLEAVLGGDEGSANEDERIARGFRAVLSAPSMQGNPAASSILSTLLTLEAKRDELRLKRTADDPEVKVLNGTIADYERQGQMFVRSSLSGLRSEIEGNQRALGSMGSQLARFPAQELELTTMQRNAEVLATLQTALRTRLKESEITNASNEGNVEVIDRAVIPRFPVSPVLTRHVALGLLLGVMLAVGGALVRDRLDRTVHSREDAQQASGAALIGLIPSFSAGDLAPKSDRKRRVAGAAAGERHAPGSAITVAGRSVIKANTSGVIAVQSPRHVAAEAYRIMRTNMRFAPAGQARQVLTVSSPSPGDGKSTTTLNYAATTAMQGLRVLLIDADMRRGTVHSKLGLSRGQGLSNFLTGRASHTDVVTTVLLDEETTLDIITCGEVPPNPAELLGGDQMSGLLAWARERYDIVLIDTPPVNLFADGLLLAATADATVLVGRANKSFKHELAMAAEQLRSLDVPVAGVVLNDFDYRRDNRQGTANYYYDRSYYQYYNSYVSTAEAGEPAA